MKITHIEAIELAIPWVDGVARSMSEHMQGAERTYVYKVFTDDGRVGVGEGGDCRGVLERYVGRDPAEFLMGTDPEPLQEALYDLVGQRLGVPVWRLLGPRQRAQVEAAYWSIDMRPDEAAAQARAAVAAGYRVHKLKVRPWYDFVAQARAIFEVVPPEYRLRPDCNGHRWPDHFTVDRLLRFARELEPFADRIDYYEGPIHDRDLSGLAHLRRQGLRISLHADPEWAALCCQAEACDYFQVGGPLSALVRTAHVAEAHGHRPVAVEVAGGGAGAGITTFWATHVAAALPNATRAIDTVPDLRVASVVANPLRPRDGLVRVPEGPGLGVELDDEVIERFRVA